MPHQASNSTRFDRMSHFAPITISDDHSKNCRLLTYDKTPTVSIQYNISIVYNSMKLSLLFESLLLVYLHMSFKCFKV